MPPAGVAPAAVRKQIESGVVDPVYLILGDDEQAMRELATSFEEVIEAGLRTFNFDRFHGGEVSLGEVLATARTLPMLASRRVVVLFRAEQVLVPKRESKGAVRDAEALAAFAADPPSHVTLVLVSAALEERSRWAKAFLKASTVVRCGQVRTVADARRWLRGQLKTTGRRVSADAVMSLVQRAGPDAMRLRKELERVLLYVPESSEVSVADVDAVAGSPAAHDDWAVANAIASRAPDRALRELGVMLDNGADPVQILGQLAWVARAKIPAVRTRSAINAVFRTDRAIKQSSGTPRILLERLVVELCGPVRG